MQRWRARGEAHTHLRLDGGRLEVPDSEGLDFLNAYAAAVVRGESLCLVETRTDPFRFFVDLDARVPSEAAFDARGACLAVAAAVFAACPGAADQPAVVCRASTTAPAAAAGQVKVGVHVHFPGVVVRPAGALWLRDRIIERLLLDWPLVDWATVVDAAVYRGSGLRLPWSGKRAGDRRVYAPVAEISRGTTVAEIVGLPVWADVPPARGVAAVRAWVVRLSVRCFGAAPTELAGYEAAADDAPEFASSSSASSESLGRFAAALPAVAASLPARFADARFVGAVSLGGGESFALRSSSRRCLNLDGDRAHTSSNVWFHVTRAGVCQRCYCRQPSAEGRAAGPCAQFASETWPVPPEALAVFFPPSPPPAPPSLAAKRRTSTLDLHERMFAKQPRRFFAK